MEKTNHSNKQLEIFPTIIPLETRVRAEKFRCYQARSDKGKQVYLNTLAVSAVNRYLHFLGWATNLKASDSHNPVLQTMMDTADLQIPGYGQLECRSVMAGDDAVIIPPEVWTGRIGYVIVRLDETLERANLLGFIRQVRESPIPLDRLESLANFPAYLSLQKHSFPESTPIISNWFAQQFDRGWQRLEEFIAPHAVFSFRTPQKQLSLTDGLATEVNRVKLVQFERNISIALILNVQRLLNRFGDRSKLDNLATTDESNEANSTLQASSPDSWRSLQEFDISMVVCNSQFQDFLPPGLELIIFDRQGHPVMIAQANETKTIEFCFSGKLGESFRIELAWGEQVRTESFII